MGTDFYLYKMSKDLLFLYINLVFLWMHENVNDIFWMSSWFSNIELVLLLTPTLEKQK